MAQINVLGAGLVGNAIALDLAGQHQVVALDIDKEKLNVLSSKNDTIKVVQTDLSSHANIANNIQSADLVVSAVPGFMGYQTLESIIQCKKNVVDIAFFPESALQLNTLAKQHNVTAIVDMGVAPGLSNLILGYHSLDLNIQNFKCMVGGLPKFPQPPFNYKAPFSPVDVIEEYTRPARVVRHGKTISLSALSEVESVKFDNIGTLEAFNTDGLRTLIDSFPDIPNMLEKTLRYPGHAALMQTLVDIGFLDTHKLSLSGHNISPLQVTTELLKKHWKLDSNEPEFTVMTIDLSGYSKQNKNILQNYHYFLYDEYDLETDTTSMARTTGYSCNAAVSLLLDKSITTKGIIPPETIGQQPECFKKICNYYANRNIRLDMTCSEKNR